MSKIQPTRNKMNTNIKTIEYAGSITPLLVIIVTAINNGH